MDQRLSLTDVIRAIIRGSLVGVLLGVVGTILYSMVVFGLSAIANTLAFNKEVSELLQGLLLAPLVGAFTLVLSGLPFSTGLICGISGAITGLAATVLTNRFNNIRITSVTCGALAAIPAIVYFASQRYSYLSTAIFLGYLPGMIYVGIVVWLSRHIHKRITASRLSSVSDAMGKL